MPFDAKIEYIIPSHNGAETIGPTLEALAANVSNFQAMSVLVLPNACSDDTVQIASGFLDRLPLRIVEREEGGKNKALNHALGLTHAPILVTMDDDVLMSPTHARDLADLADRYPAVDFFSGPIRPKFPYPLGTALERMLTSDMRAAIFAELDLETKERACPPHYFYGPAIAMRRRLFDDGTRFSEQIGPNSTGSYAMGSETEFLSRMERAGATGVYSETLGVDHLIERKAMELSWMYGRAERAGRGLVRKEQLAVGSIETPRRRAFWHARHAARLFLMGTMQKLTGRKAEGLRTNWRGRKHLGSAKECLTIAKAPPAGG